MVFHRALASSVGVKDGTLTSRAVSLVHPQTFLGNNLYRIWCTLRNHCKTSLAEYWEGGGGGTVCQVTSRTIILSAFVENLVLDIFHLCHTRLSDNFICVRYEII